MPLYQGQTELAIKTFNISDERVHPKVIRALLHIKKFAAQTNQELGFLDTDKQKSIDKAVDKVLEDSDFMKHFPVDVFQTGSGTNTNMNVNEVVSTLSRTHQNNDVNMSQSSNDTFPSSIQIASSVAIADELRPALNNLIKTIEAKAQSLKGKTKTGRTHSMDAMPIGFDQEFMAWAQALKDAQDNLTESLQRLQKLPLGGTAVGTGINAPAQYAETVSGHLAKHYNIAFSPTEQFSSRMGSQHALLDAANALSNLATTINKIASDLILLNSGPLCGLGDIKLPKHLEGSSIMPGKVNPVIAESACQVYARVMGHHATIQIGSGNSRLQLNVYLPVMANSLMNMIELLTTTCTSLAGDLETLEINTTQVEKTLSRNPILVTGLNRIIGYPTGKKIALKSLAEDRPIIEVALEMTDLSREELEKALDPARLAEGGIIE